jgi:hypothetical protein
LKRINGRFCDSNPTPSSRSRNFRCPRFCATPSLLNRPYFMQSSPNRFSQKKSSKLPVAKSQFTSAQHESHHPDHQHQQQPGLDGPDSSNDYRSILHRAPYETLCHITAYLDPPSLGSLLQVDRYLRKCVSDDVMWRSALFFSVLGIHPERERDSPRRFLLRRLESTWKAEYITRYNVLLYV